MSFDPLARPYRWLERLTFGRALERCRFAHLPALVACRRTLILGEGDGRFLAAFLAMNTSTIVDVIDVSPAMLRLAAGRISDRARVVFHHRDAVAEPLPAVKYDLVVTNFFLDCFRAETLARLVPKIAAACQWEARWQVGEFRLPPRGPARWRAQAYLATMYPLFRAITGIEADRLPDHAPHLSEAGFALVSEQPSQHGMLTSQLWQRGGGPID